jgi:hypothetical protein
VGLTTVAVLLVMRIAVRFRREIVRVGVEMGAEERRSNG